MTDLGPESGDKIAYVDMGFCGDAQMEGEMFHTGAEVDDLARQGYTVVDVEAGIVARPVEDDPEWWVSRGLLFAGARSLLQHPDAENIIDTAVRESHDGFDKSLFPDEEWD